jgi:hypothetical protein
MTPKAPRCEGRCRYDGTPCAALSRPGSRFCYHHDPTKAEERKAAQARAIATLRDTRARKQEKLAREMKR